MAGGRNGPRRKGRDGPVSAPPAVSAPKKKGAGGAAGESCSLCENLDRNELSRYNSIGYLCKHAFRGRGPFSAPLGKGQRFYLGMI